MIHSCERYRWICANGFSIPTIKRRELARKLRTGTEFHSAWSRSSCSSADALGISGRAIAFALIDLGAAQIVIHDKDHERAQMLVSELSSHFSKLRCEAAKDVTDAVVEAIHSSNV